MTYASQQHRQTGGQVTQLMESRRERQAHVGVRARHARHEVELDFGRFIHECLHRSLRFMKKHYTRAFNTSLETQVKDLLVRRLLVSLLAVAIRQDACERIHSFLQAIQLLHHAESYACVVIMSPPHMTRKRSRAWPCTGSIEI